MSRSTTVCLNPTAPEFIPAAKPCERTPMTRAALPWLPIDQELPTSYEYGAEVTYLSFLHSQDHGYQMPLHDPASFGTHLISDPPLLEAMPQFFFENFLRHTRRQANILAKESAYATGDAMMAKLASASLGFLHSLGYVRICHPLVQEPAD